MKNYIIYETFTGKILCTGVCQDENFYKQVEAGESIREGIANDELHAIDIYTGMIIPKPPEPEYIPTLAEVKKQKLEEIKREFNASFYRGYTTQTLSQNRNIKVDCRRTDKENFETLVRTLERNGETTATIRDYNNTFHPNITLVEIKTIIDELEDYGVWLYQHKWELEMRLEAATTKGKAEAIIW